jgi:hypothetical protein
MLYNTRAAGKFSCLELSGRRPQLAAALVAAEKRKAAVAVPKFDRLSRDVRPLVGGVTLDHAKPAFEENAARGFPRGKRGRPPGGPLPQSIFSRQSTCTACHELRPPDVGRFGAAAMPRSDVTPPHAAL